jgi:hypothetical protein
VRVSGRELGTWETVVANIKSLALTVQRYVRPGKPVAIDAYSVTKTRRSKPPDVLVVTFDEVPSAWLEFSNAHNKGLDLGSGRVSATLSDGRIEPCVTFSSAFTVSMTARVWSVDFGGLVWNIELNVMSLREYGWAAERRQGDSLRAQAEAVRSR